MLLSISHENVNIEFELIFRRRKTMAIRVEPSRTVTVFAPMGSSRKDIIKNVQKSAPWIVKKLQAFNSVEPYRPKQFVNGERFLYLGTEYPLKITPSASLKRAAVRLEADVIEVRIDEGEEAAIKEALEKWYRKEAKRIIPERVEHYRSIIGKTPGRVVVKEQKKRWGSCSSRGNLNFNWKIVMAPLPVLDYIVVHEMCHLIHLNHSREFWSLVERILPDYLRCKDWLQNSYFTLNI